MTTVPFKVTVIIHNGVDGKNDLKLKAASNVYTSPYA